MPGGFPGVEGERFHGVEFLGRGRVQNVEAATAEGRGVKRSPLRRGAKDGYPIDGLRKQATSSQIPCDAGLCGADLGRSEDWGSRSSALNSTRAGMTFGLRL